MRSGNSATARPGFRLTFPLLSAKLIKQIRRKEVIVHVYHDQSPSDDDLGSRLLILKR